MSVTVYKIDDNLKCRCGHPWKMHHPMPVTNPAYASYPLVIHGSIAEECEYRELKGTIFYDAKYCQCQAFKPKARNVQKTVDEWVKKNG